MKLWLVKWDRFNTYRPWYDCYDSFVCAAETEGEARNMMPSEYSKWGEYDWAKSVDEVSATCIGTTDRESAGVILASFNSA